MSDKMQKISRVDKELLELRKMPDSFKHSRISCPVGTLINVSRTAVAFDLYVSWLCSWK